MASSKDSTPEDSQEENEAGDHDEDMEIEDESSMQVYILRYSDKDITVNVDSATAYLLANDHSYAEKYAESVMNNEIPTEPPEIEYLIEDDGQPQTENSGLIPVVTLTTGKQEQSGNTTIVPKSLWTFGHMELLLKVRLSLESKFRHSTSKSCDLWEQVAKKINSMSSIHTTGTICLTKWRNMINTYKRVLRNKSIMSKTPNWPLFDVCFEAYGDLTLNDIVGKYISSPRPTRTNPKDGVNNIKWTNCSTKLLIQTRLEMDVQFRSPKQSKLQLWLKIADKINAELNLSLTGNDCDSKWRSLTKTYRKVSIRMQETGDNVTSWSHYKLMDKFFSSTSEAFDVSVTDVTDGLTLDIAVSNGDEEFAVSQHLWPSSDIELLLSTRLGMQAVFSDIYSDKDALWTSISKKINCVSSLPHPGIECKAKWIQLLCTYKCRLDCYERGEDPNMWPYFKMFDDVYKGFIVNHDGDTIQEEKTAVWTGGATRLLIQTRIDMDNRFQSQSIKKTILWVKVASEINSVYPLNLTGADCDCKWRNLTGTYRKICSRINETGEKNSSWPYYELIDTLYGSKNTDQTSDTNLGFEVTGEEDEFESSSHKYWSQSAVSVLIKARTEMEEEFQKPNSKRNILWNGVAKTVNEVIRNGTVSGTECNIKWRNLKRTYRLLLSRIKKNRGTKPNWPYFKSFYNLYGDMSNNKVPVEMEVSFNEHHGYVFKVLPTNVVGESQQTSHNTSTFQQKPVPIQPSSDSQPKKSQAVKRLLSYPEEEVPGPSKVCSDNKDDKWLKLMLLDWKKERRERWEEKKRIEREKITAVNNLTQAILSLERKGK